jgi:type I restriction enzyme R subunit
MPPHEVAETVLGHVAGSTVVRGYTQYPPDFFDFIVIDECHRGGAKDESEWRRLLEYFEPAAQLGLTATPKRKHNADTYAYFGEPVYTYALRDGIEDGFLTPFKVRQMASTIDAYVYDGSDDVIVGDVEHGESFTESDFNTRIIIAERERSRVKEFMSQMDQRQKTLVFCATQDHAALVRDQINQVKDIANPNYCHRVTADDGAVGEQHLRDFQDNDKTIPTILTTSQKLSTGVDARNVRHIVLMRPIRSMIEFKQIIGRGTRTYDGKDFFTIWDFVKAHENFNDPEWDGEPLAPEPPKDARPSPDGPGPEDESPDPEDDGGKENPQGEKIEVKLSDGKVRTIRYIATTSYWGPDGKPMSAIEFLERLVGDLSGIISDEDHLRTLWSDPDNRERFLGQLADRGYDHDRLDTIRGLVDATDSDLFDVLGHVLFTRPPKSRHDRANGVRAAGFSGADQELRDLLLSILSAYEESGETELATRKLGSFLSARYGSVTEGKDRLGGLDGIKAAFRRLQANLYSS